MHLKRIIVKRDVKMHANKMKIIIITPKNKASRPRYKNGVCYVIKVIPLKSFFFLFWIIKCFYKSFE